MVLKVELSQTPILREGEPHLMICIDLTGNTEGIHTKLGRFHFYVKSAEREGEFPIMSDATGFRGVVDARNFFQLKPLYKESRQEVVFGLMTIPPSFMTLGCLRSAPITFEERRFLNRILQALMNNVTDLYDSLPGNEELRAQMFDPSFGAYRSLKRVTPAHALIQHVHELLGAPMRAMSIHNESLRNHLENTQSRWDGESWTPEAVTSLSVLADQICNAVSNHSEEKSNEKTIKKDEEPIDPLNAETTCKKKTETEKKVEKVEKME